MSLTKSYSRDNDENLAGGPLLLNLERRVGDAPLLHLLTSERCKNGISEGANEWYYYLTGLQTSMISF